jgi:hypothetical protein
VRGGNAFAVRALHFLATSTLIAPALLVIGATVMKANPTTLPVHFRLANMVCLLVLVDRHGLLNSIGTSDAGGDFGGMPSAVSQLVHRASPSPFTASGLDDIAAKDHAEGLGRPRRSDLFGKAEAPKLDRSSAGGPRADCDARRAGGGRRGRRRRERLSVRASSTSSFEGERSSMLRWPWLVSSYFNSPHYFGLEGD